jgi:Ricin-type beta-trefoil lectin domain-like/HYR domain/SdrD B-like domain/Secretion system C-terminal sorting domain
MSKISTFRFYKLSLYLLLIIFIFRTNPALAQTSSCQPIERAVYNAKSTNTNLFDDIGVIMTNVLNDNSETGWLFEAGTTFTENNDGSANLKGTIKQFGDYTQVRRFTVDLTLKGQTFTPPPGSPYNKTGVSTEGWYYYTSIEGTFTGLDGIAGGKLGIVLHMKAFQAGIGANQLQDEILDQTANGGSGWFEWTVLNQPSTGILFNDYKLGTTVADIAMLLQSTPSVPCCTASAGSVSILNTEFTLNNKNALIESTLSLNSQVPTGYRIGYVLTYGDNKIIKEINSNPKFNISDTGKYCIHVMVYNPGALDLRGIKNDTTKASEIASMLRENGGNICASLNLEGSCFTVKNNPCDTDDVPPVLTNCPKNISVSTNSHCGVASWTPPTATDNCDIAALAFITAPVAGWINGDCFPIGTTTVTYTATDLKGNKASCNFDIIVISTCDNVKDAGLFEKKCINGAIVLQNTVNPSGGTGTVEYQWMKSIYACPDSMHHAIAGATNESLSVGSVSQTTYFVRCSRIMGCNNWVGETICVTVNPDDCNPCMNDKTPPTLSNCSADIHLTTTTDCAVATWVAPTSTDSCSTPSVILTSSPTVGLGIGSCFPVGTTILTYTATDIAGNTTICSFKIIVTKTGSIGDQTYCDNNNNGKYDTGDVPATNLTITLCDANFATLKTQAVDANGNYTFNNLVAGTYWVKFPTATLDGKPLTTASPIKVVLTEGQNFLDADAGYYKAPAVPTCNINFDPTKCYKIVNKGSGKVLDVSGASAANDASIIQWQSTGKANQTWKFSTLGNDYFKIASQNCGKVIACHSTTNGSAVYQYDYYTGGYKDWKIECVGNYYKITHRASGKVLDICNNSTADGAKLQIWDYNGGNNQLWEIVEVPCVSTIPVNPCDNDTQAPTFVKCPTNINLTTNTTTACANWSAPSALDNCGTPSVSCTFTSGFAFPVGTTIVTYTAKDAKGNKATCSFTVTVVKNCNPKLTFTNKCNFSVNIFWDNNGSKVKSACISAGQSWSCNTSDTYKWMVCNASTGTQVATYTVSGCGDQICTISSPVSQACNLTFYNKTNSNCNIYWINNLGQKIFYKTLSGNQCYTQSTFYGHKWVVCNNSGQVLNNYTVTQYGNSWCNVYSNSCNWWALNSAQVLTLEARLSQGRTALNWVNNTGFKNDFFSVQRLNNITGAFEDLKILNNLEDSNELTTYTEYDDNPQADENHYRIKVTYGDGTVAYTETKIVKTLASVGIKVFPNPAVEYAEIDLSTYESSAVKISIFNAWGQLERTYNIENAAMQPFRMDVSSLKAGNFIINITSNGKRQVNQKLSISK